MHRIELSKRKVHCITGDITVHTYNSLCQVLQDPYEHLDKMGLTILLNTQGGDAFAAFAICEMIRLYSKTVNIVLVTTGLCQSSGTIIMTALPQRKRYATRLTRFMMHSPTVTSDEPGVEPVKCQPSRPTSLLKVDTDRVITPLRPAVGEGYEVQEVMIERYVNGTHLTEAEVRTLLKTDSFFWPDKALEYGLIGHIL